MTTPDITDVGAGSAAAGHGEGCKALYSEFLDAELEYQRQRAELKGDRLLHMGWSRRWNAAVSSEQKPVKEAVKELMPEVGDGITRGLQGRLGFDVE